MVGCLGGLVPGSVGVQVFTNRRLWDKMLMLGTDYKAPD